MLNKRKGDLFKINTLRRKTVKKVALDQEKVSKSSGKSECDEDRVEAAEHKNAKRLPASVRKVKEQ